MRKNLTTTFTYAIIILDKERGGRLQWLFSAHQARYAVFLLSLQFYDYNGNP